MFGFFKKKKKISTYYKWEKPKYLLPPIETLSYRGKIKKETQAEILEEDNIYEVMEQPTKREKAQRPKLRYEWFQPKSIIPPIETLVPVGIPNAKKPEDTEEAKQEEVKQIKKEKPKKQPTHRYAHGKCRIDYNTACKLKPKTIGLEKEEIIQEPEIEMVSMPVIKTKKAVQKRGESPERKKTAASQVERKAGRPATQQIQEEEIEIQNVRKRSSVKTEPEMNANISQRTARRQTIRESEMDDNSRRRQNRRPY